MQLANRIARRLGRAVRSLGSEVQRRAGLSGTWIDVGAHNGEASLQAAIDNPGLTVYALEPNLAAFARILGRAANYIVIPMAVAEQDGVSDFYVNKADVASSLLPLNEASRQSWIGGEVLAVDAVRAVPTIRLDTLMSLLGVGAVDFLKIDAQGADLAVVRSAGPRLKDIQRVMLEADVSPTRLYEGSASREEVIAYMEEQGFRLTDVSLQSHGQEQNLTFLRDGRKR
jgi:FkbM family methyltransferase